MDKVHHDDGRNVYLEGKLALSKFFESAPMMMGIVDVEGDDIRHIADNEASEKFFKNSLEGKLSSELGIPQAVRSNWLKHYHKAEETREPVHFEYNHGDHTVLNVSVSFIEKNDQGFSRFSYIARDVSEEKAAQKSLLKSKELDAERESAFLRTVLNHVPIAVWITEAPTGKVIIDNPIAKRFMTDPAKPLKSIEDYSTFPVFHKDGTPFQSHEYPGAKALRGEIVHNEEINFKRPDGTDAYAVFSSSPVYDKNGNITSAVTIGIDVSEQVKRREQLKESESRFRIIANALPLIVWTATPEFEINWYNEWWYDYLRMPKGTTWDDPVRNPMHPDDREITITALKEAVVRGDKFEMEQRFKCGKDGEYRWHLVRGVAVKDELGNIIKWVGANVDIHDQKVLLEKLKEEQDLREKFVATLSHDLRTPLTSAKLTAQLIRRSNATDEKITKSTDRITNNIDRADSMIQDLLDASRLSAGEELAVNKGNCDLTHIVHEALDDLRNVHGRNIKFVEMTKSICGHWDCNGIRRIIENLCNNAVKYGDQTLPITVKVEPSKNSRICLSVHNFGNPIPPEELEYLFQPYKRASTARNKKGWGIGLMLVKGVVQSNGGEIEVRSSEEEGTTFLVYLPLTTE